MLLIIVSVLKASNIYFVADRITHLIVSRLMLSLRCTHESVMKCPLRYHRHYDYATVHTNFREEMAVPQGYQVVGGGHQPSCWTKLKLGFMMGAVIGGATGVLLGSFAAFRMGLRGREMLQQVGKIAAQSGGSFGVFMMVAQGLRC